MKNTLTYKSAITITKSGKPSHSQRANKARAAQAAEDSRQKLQNETAHTAEVEQARATARATAQAQAAPFNISPNATAAEIYTAADVAVSIAVRALYNKSGLQLYRDIQTDFYADRRARQAAAIYSRQAQATDTRAEHRARAAQYKAIATAAGTADEERTAALELYEEERTAAEQANSVATTQAAALDSVTLSQNRSDLTQAAALAIVETWTNPAPITAGQKAAAGLEPDEEPDPETAAALQTAANFRAAINAARMESTRLAHPNAADHTSTTKKAVTAAEVEQWAATMGGTGKEYRRTAYRKNTAAMACYQTIEQDKKGQWYKITHYKTVSRYTSIEAAEEAAGHPIIAPDSYTDKETAAAALLDIIAAADLTERERQAVRAYTGTQATQAADLARAAHLASKAASIAAETDTGRKTQAIKRANVTAENKATAARWDKALTLAGYTNDKARQRAKAAIIAKLKAAIRHPHADPKRDVPSRRPDLIKALETQSQSRRQTMQAVTYCDTDTGRMMTAYTETAMAAAAAIMQAKARAAHKPQTEPKTKTKPTTAKTAQEAARAARTTAEAEANRRPLSFVMCSDLDESRQK